MHAGIFRGEVSWRLYLKIVKHGEKESKSEKMITIASLDEQNMDVYYIISSFLYIWNFFMVKVEINQNIIKKEYLSGKIT